MKIKAQNLPKYCIATDDGQLILFNDKAIDHSTKLSGTFYSPPHCQVIIKNNYYHSETRIAMLCEDTSGSYRVCGWSVKLNHDPN